MWLFDVHKLNEKAHRGLFPLWQKCIEMSSWNYYGKFEYCGC